MPSAHIASAPSPAVSPLGLILKEMLSWHSAKERQSSHVVRRGAPHSPKVLSWTFFFFVFLYSPSRKVHLALYSLLYLPTHIHGVALDTGHTAHPVPYIITEVAKLLTTSWGRKAVEVLNVHLVLINWGTVKGPRAAGQ